MNNLSSPPHSYVNANGMHIAYDEFGDPANPAIILIMGLGTQMIAWPVPFCEDLARQGYRVIRFDNRDVGLSQKLTGEQAPGLFKSVLRARLGLPGSAPYTLNDMAADTVGVMDALAIKAAHLVGASMGGMIAQLVAGHYPERTLSLTSIMSSSGHRSLPGPSVRLAMQVFKSVDQESEQDYVARLTRNWALIGSPGYPVADDVLQQKLSFAYRRSYYPQGARRHSIAIVASGDRAALLKSIGAPTLVIHGKDDALVPVECGIDTARRVAYSRLELIEGMGHNLPEPLLPRFAQLIAGHAGAIR